jgi:hypothetical protein|tara:strand:+ start:1022 stop:1330 length:309 start_codon:yes stop_codon:yes gene_type:complete
MESNKELEELMKVDDSFVREVDKKGLINNLEIVYSKKFPWADDVLLESIVTIEYKRHIKNMDKNKYLKEISSTNDVNKYMQNKKKSEINYYLDKTQDEVKII